MRVRPMTTPARRPSGRRVASLRLRFAPWALLALVAMLSVDSIAAPPGKDPCESPETRGYIASLRWPKPAQPEKPSASWQACLGSLQADSVGRYRASILKAFAALRSRRAAPPIPGPADPDDTLLRGSESHTLTRDMLPNWRGNLDAPVPTRLGNVYYQALLGALALTILERSSGLERVEVLPVRDLQSAAKGPPDWERIEKTLPAFEHGPLWKTPGAAAGSLTELRDQATGADVERGREVVKQIAMERSSSVYWVRVAKLIGGLPPQSAPGRVTQALYHAPPGCRSSLCLALGRCDPAGDPASWTALQKEYDAEVKRLDREDAAIRKSLPDAVDWSSLDRRLEDARTFSQSVQRASAGGLPAPAVERAVGNATEISGRLEALRRAVVYRDALTSLLQGDARQAKQQVLKVADWKGQARLAATFVAASFWETGPRGASQACAEMRLPCASRDVRQEIARVAGILGLDPQKLQADHRGGGP